MSHQSELIASDITSYLHQHENKELLRLITCGSVDDGKSTLIGRLLHDSKMIYEDQLAAITRDSKKVGTTGDTVDLALLVDGLQAEREQGITIDVAYRYFSTAKRKFIIADTPGHEQYTRNMATGASTCDLAIILIDARHGVQVQTRRHSFIVSMLGIRHTLVAINKMDLVEYSEARFEEIKADYLAFSQSLNLPDIQFAPISALKGDNVVNPSDHMPWYCGLPLMAQLEAVEIAQDQNLDQLRFPVQYVNRPHLNFRGYCGTLASGVVNVGDSVTVLPSGKQSRVSSIITWDGALQKAFAPMAITLTLEDEIDISRGDLLVHSHAVPDTHQTFDAHLVWMDEQPLNLAREYEVKLATSRQPGRIRQIYHQINVNTHEPSSASRLELNEIGLVEISLQRPVVADEYSTHKTTGAFILVDRLSNRTVAAGMIRQHATQHQQLSLTEQSTVSVTQWQQRLGQQGHCIQVIGGSPSQRNIVMFSLEKALFERGRIAWTMPQQDSETRAVGLTDAWVDWLIRRGIVLITDLDAELSNAFTVNLDETVILDQTVILDETVAMILNQID